MPGDPEAPRPTVSTSCWFEGPKWGADQNTNTPNPLSTPEQRNIEFIDRMTSEERKACPLATGVLDYFPLALLYVAKVSKRGNDKHNPGEPLHWAREKSMDQMDTVARHILTRQAIGADGILHGGNLAWRALADLQLELERRIAEGGNPFALDKEKPTS